jgi:hypothetical protein
MTLQVAVLLLAFVSAQGAAPSAAPVSEAQTVALNEIVQAIRDASTVESFRVRCIIKVTPGGGVAWYDSVPKIWQCPVVSQGPALAPAARVTLEHLVARAGQDSCGAGRSCLFDGRYAFRFHDRVPPLDLVISHECTSWIFCRGDKSLMSDAGLTGYTDCVRDSLRYVLTMTFGDVDRSFEGSWPLVIYR